MCICLFDCMCIYIYIIHVLLKVPGLRKQIFVKAQGLDTAEPEAFKSAE